MAELFKIQFLFFVSLMIFPARALDVILSGAHQNFKQKSEIHIDIMDGEKIYRGTLNELTYETEFDTSKVIVYIISRSRCIEILRPAGVACETRSQIARELRENHCELVFLGIEHFDDDEGHLIGEFILDKIQRQSNQRNLNIETIGENRFDRFYRCHVRRFGKYQENAQTLVARLRSIPHGAIRPVENNNKEVKLYGFKPIVKEVRLPVSLENDIYVPHASVENFTIKYPKKKICLLILSGKEYSAVTSYGSRCSQRAAIKELLNAMSKKKEVLFIMGVFNFDWTEIDIVTQIILKHSERSRSSDYNVFTCGYGMFNTYYVNEDADDEREIHQQSNSYVSEVIKLLVGEEVKERAIKVHYYYDYKWDSTKMPINLSNGRFVPEEKFENETLSSKLLSQKIAFIVFARSEKKNSIDYSVVIQSVEELKLSGISVVLIEAINFRLDDMHIIAEWIDHHSGVNDSEQIAVLGGGIFDTIFQSEYTTYNTFFNTKKNELEKIRNAHVKNGNGKCVSVAKLDENPGFGVLSYPMNPVVNGFYELDLIRDKNMFNITEGGTIYFIVTSAYIFQQISAMENVGVLSSFFRQSINQYYPISKWDVFLVGLDDFEERDSHLFAELVKRQTNDGRSFSDYGRCINYGISEAIYQYRDTAPFVTDSPASFLYEVFKCSLGMHIQT